MIRTAVENARGRGVIGVFRLANASLRYGTILNRRRRIHTAVFDLSYKERDGERFGGMVGSERPAKRQKVEQDVNASIDRTANSG